MQPAPDTHATHDPLAIAAYAAGDATGGELAAASALVATCEACAALHHDLRAIALALPATASAAPAPRPRDFRLTPDQAASLRPTGWRRLLAPFASPSFSFAKPLGTGLATLGLTGILVAGAAGIPLGGAAAMPADTASGGGEVAMQAPEASAAAAAEDPLFLYNAAATEAPAAGDGGPGPVPGATALPDRELRSDDGGATAATGPAMTKAPADQGNEVQGGGAAPEGADEILTTANESTPLAPAVPPTAWLAGAALLALALGLALLTLRWTARRLV